MTDAELRPLLADRLADVEGRIRAACERSGRPRDAVMLVAVSKSVGVRVAVMMAELGVGDFGENRPQELWKKAAALPGVRWHLIGQLQRNKAERTLPLLTLIHSVDRLSLLDALDELGRRRGVPVPVLLQVNASREAAKSGFAPEEVLPLAAKLVQAAGLHVRGLMAMAAHHDDPEAARPTFAELRTLRAQLRTATGLSLLELSMGMSNDFTQAVEEGSTLVRVGSTLFEGLTGE